MVMYEIKHCQETKYPIISTGRWGDFPGRVQTGPSSKRRLARAAGALWSRLDA